MERTPLSTLEASIQRSRRCHDRARRRQLILLTQRQQQAAHNPLTQSCDAVDDAAELSSTIYEFSDIHDALDLPANAVPGIVQNAHPNAASIEISLASTLVIPSQFVGGEERVFSGSTVIGEGSQASTIRIQTAGSQPVTLQQAGMDSQTVRDTSPTPSNSSTIKDSITETGAPCEPNHQAPCSVPSAPSDRPPRSWASGSLTTSLREMIGLPPLSLPGGRLRPPPEPPSGPAPPRWPCISKTTLHSCGYAFNTTTHTDRCLHNDVANEAVVESARPASPDLDRWGLPPSAQRERKAPCPEQTATMTTVGAPCRECGPSAIAPASTRTEWWLEAIQGGKRSSSSVVRAVGGGVGGKGPRRRQ